MRHERLGAPRAPSGPLAPPPAENLQFSSLSVVGNERIEVIGVDGWQKWCALFEDMDDRDRRLEALDAQLSQAIEEENYSYAAR